MLFYDFEVFAYDWLAVMLDSDTHKEHVIINSYEQLNNVYQVNKDNIWVGYNSRHYDQYILKAILALGLNEDGTDDSVRIAKQINDFIIRDHQDGWKFSNTLKRIPLNNYDTMPNPPVGLKTLEGFLGSDIKETDVPFDVDRKLTKEELDQTVYYCRHDVQQTVQVFLQRTDNFEAQFGIIKAFNLPLQHIGDTEARITATVLDCSRHDFRDEFEYWFFDCLQIEKYKDVLNWFEQEQREAKLQDLEFDSDQGKREWYRNQELIMDVAGVPHSFGFGGLHGAPDHPVHMTGQILHVDVNNYYPSILVSHDLVTRAAQNDNYEKIYETRKELKYKQTHAETKEKAKEYKKAQLPYKKMLNALSGSMKDATNAAYDPRNNNAMCINGQLMLLDLIEHLEVVPGFELIQSNTDGLIIRIPDTDKAFDQVDDICWEWEQRCSTPKGEIRLELDNIKEIYQKDVNNYLWIDADGNVTRIGKYVKELSPIDNDLPILNTALVEYMVNKTPVEDTINSCQDMIQFQKIVKLSDKYDHVEHNGTRYTYKSYRVFASLDLKDGRVLKCKPGKNGEKFADTPDHCFIYNGNLDGMGTSDKLKLDRQWYIDFAKKRLQHFGID